jgi:hypothetical protein
MFFAASSFATQYERPLRRHLHFQGFQHFPDCFSSTVEDGARPKIREIQRAERTGFPPAHLPAQDFLSKLVLYLTRQKITEMPMPGVVESWDAPVSGLW